MNKHITDRREFLRLAGLAAAVGAALPLQAFPAQAATAGSVLPADPDQLFLRGWFDAADRGYAQQLRQDPDSEHALAQRGYIALLSGRLGAAEAFLTRAIQLNPNDTFSVGKLADCCLRQDQFARAVPLLRQTGNASDTAQAAQFAAVGGVPYQVRGARSTRVPIVSIDPLPIIEASLNGGSPQPFIFDTGATTPGFSNELAAELGLTPVSSTTGDTGNGQVTLNFGWLESFQVGEIELRNIPVQWGNTNLPAPPGGPVPVGALGTVFMFRFLATLDYAGKGFVLRRKTEGGLREFQAAASRDGYRPLPLWLADTRNGAPHFPCTLGSLSNFGPRVVSMDTGGRSRGVETTSQVAREAGITIDYNDPIVINGMAYPSIHPDSISLGDAVGQDVPGIVTSMTPASGPGGFQFDTTANFTHEYFKQFAVTLDYLGMNLYVTPTVPDHR